MKRYKKRSVESTKHDPNLTLAEKKLVIQDALDELCEMCFSGLEYEEKQKQQILTPVSLIFSSLLNLAETEVKWGEIPDLITHFAKVIEKKGRK